VALSTKPFFTLSWLAAKDVTTMGVRPRRALPPYGGAKPMDLRGLPDVPAFRRDTFTNVALQHLRQDAG
jgi:hypothetical protein